jgi:hypothetical protein
MSGIFSSLPNGLASQDLEEDSFIMERCGGLPSRDDPDWIEAGEGRPDPRDPIAWANGAV